MTIFAHFGLVAMMSDMAGLPGEVSEMLGLVAAYPDLVAVPDHVDAMVAAKRLGRSDWWKARNWGQYYYYWHVLYRWVWYNPLWALHRWLDRITHGEDGKYTTFGRIAEGMIWVAFGAYFLGKWGLL